KHLLAERPVEALDKGILVRLSGLDVQKGHTIGFEPSNECLTQELRPIVAPYNPRQSTFLFQLLEHTNQALRIYRSVDLDVYHLAVEIIQHVESSEAPTTAQ